LDADVRKEIAAAGAALEREIEAETDGSMFACVDARAIASR
jgi:hypothetical protein